MRALPRAAPLLLLATDFAAATLLVAEALGPGEARFRWRKETLDSLAQALALRELASTRCVPLRGLGHLAIVTRVVHELASSGSLGRYAQIAERPGFVRALGKTLTELRLACIEPARVAPHAPELGRLLATYERLLDETKLADRATVFRLAARALTAGDHELANIPVVALDVPLRHQAELELALALAGDRASEVSIAASIARGDDRSEAHWRVALGGAVEVVRLEPEGGHDLALLQARLFNPTAGEVRAVERGRVTIVSSPGEAREAVEIARGLLDAAAKGVPFDRMAVVLRAVEGYRAVVEEALARAEVPAYFAEGVRRPRVEGRALVLLLACARDGLSATAFAEYLSLGAYPRDADRAELVSPRKWEKLLVDAAVIGGRARWERRLLGLRRELADERALLPPDDPRRERLEQEQAQLARLADFALPLIDLLARAPNGGSWGALLGWLEEVAQRGLAEPDGVVDVLRELAPLAPIAPVTLRAAHRVLAPRLTSYVQPSQGPLAGKVFVGAIEDVRGRSFERVFVPGLAERLFPPRLSEDPLLPDAQRRELGPELWVTEERVLEERLSLRIAVGAASSALTLSFPRFDVLHGRPRVPSFYGLEILQAIDGALPAFDELTRRALPGAAAKMGFPAPELAEQAIDDAEYDLSMLDRLRRAPTEARRGAARYLLEANVHLARALRFRARRWELARFSPADGFVAASDEARALLAPHRLAARAYSPTALAQLAACPYRFFLHAIMRIAERADVLAADELDARTQGVLFHRVQRLVLTELERAGLLPLASEQLDEARALLEQVFATVAREARDRYAPSIERVFEASLSAMHRDLSEWLERLRDEQRWVPLHLELGFGLARGRELDPSSKSESVSLSSGIQLTGAIDLVERSLTTAEGALVLRATDHKTGRAGEALGTLGGGRSLQPALYALALEQLFPGAKIEGGRLYFCTARGEFNSHEVPLDASTRKSVDELAENLDLLLEQGFLPADPARQPESRDRYECERCAYRVICGPYEPERVGHVKGRDFARLAPVAHVRNLP